MKLIFLLVLLIVAATGIGAYLSPNDLAGCQLRPTEEVRCQPAGAIVAVSGGDTAARARGAIGLYENGWAPKLIFSGAAQDKSGPSNAAAMRQIAIEAGVPASAILIEEHGRTTGQNADKTKALIGDDATKSIIVVTSAYHQRRAGLEFSRAFSGTIVRNFPSMQDKQWPRWWWLSPRGWYLTVGELAKITVYYAEEIGR